MSIILHGTINCLIYTYILIYYQIEVTNCLGKEMSPQLYDQRLLSVHALDDTCENETSLSELSPTTASTTTNTTALSLSELLSYFHLHASIHI